MRLLKDQRGIGHVVEIVIIAIIVLGVGGFIAWRVWGTQQSNGTNNSTNSEAQSALQQAIANATCDYDDKDLCKFMTSWRLNSDIKVESKQTVDGQTTSSTYSSTNNGANFHLVMDVNGMPYEGITIGTTQYTKDNTDGSWWKQTIEVAEAAEASSDYDYEFDEPGDSTATNQTSYKKLGTEQCGSLTCFKYQIVDPSNPQLNQYIWFDNQTYQMRRMLMEDSTSSTDQTFSYENISVVAPSPTKDLPEGSYLVPGSDTPVSIPTGL